MFDQITHNGKVHDLIAPLYEDRHVEIFNQTEQLRLSELLSYATKAIQTDSEIPRVLDYGAGTGNLTRHLLNLGAAVVASDVSSACLRELTSSSSGSERLELSLLNGFDLSQFAEESFDMVATYSVLHHVPDYCAILSEFVRVVKPGGIIYIDHEVCPSYWENRQEYQMYCSEVSEQMSAQQDTYLQRLSHVINHRSWWRYLLSTLRVKWNQVSDEGDIHVYPDDHIDWHEIRDLLEPCCDILRENDYLVCRERGFPAPVWEKWHSHCVDMRLIVAIKR